MKRFAILLSSLVASCALAATALAATDVLGSKDNALLGRIEGSRIASYKAPRLNDYVLALSPVAKYDYDKKKPILETSKAVRGTLTRLTYFAPADISSLAMFETYKTTLTSKGFTLLYEAAGPSFGGDQGEMYGDIEGQLLEYSPKASHYLAAQMDTPNGPVYVALYITEYEMGATTLPVKPGQTIAQVDIVEPAGAPGQMAQAASPAPIQIQPQQQASMVMPANASAQKLAETPVSATADVGGPSASGTVLAFRTKVGGVSVPAGQSLKLGSVDVDGFQQIRIVADERVGSGSGVNIRVTLTEGSELVGQLTTIHLNPHSEMTDVYAVPGTRLTLFADAQPGSGADQLDVLIYGHK